MATTLPEPAPATVGAAELLQDLYGGYAALRATAPVQRITGPDGLPFWLVTRYQDVRELLTDPRLSLDRRNAVPGNYRGLALPPALDANLLNMDPPDHTRIRRLVSQAFTPRRIEQLRAPIQRTADELLDRIEPLGRADLVADYAGPFPIAVICDLLGVAAEDRRDFRAWTDAIITPDPAQPQQAKAAVAGMLEFFARLIARKRAEPGDDLLAAMITARDEGDRLSEDELTSLAFLILFAGYENTVQLIGNSVLALLDHPEQLAELRCDPALLPAAVEELTRYDTPAPLAIRRFPLEDVTVGEVTIPAGETVLLALGSANRDPGHYDRPDRLDLHRQDSAHLSLGHGIHYCIGAPLARMETGIALAALLRRFPGLALDVPRDSLRWRPSIRARGLLALPVRF
ncbi:cytochrome P450 family protein [Saccharothrix sp. ST-888]|uniref:cytochrome P450 family protein n=1 Tax=Saccharothrix sp. ST-888 TaxID=1427391 RepID=UPI0005EC3FCE|nr:cytochrome P450 [Saccharothrix sp. ST-888]KJK59401.1 cytochrome P450 [Saccharothrix sp. ST-888]